MMIERSDYTNSLIERLGKCKEDDFVSYQELSDWASGDVRSERYSNLGTALRFLQREDKKQFTVVRGKGLRCIKNGEQIRLAQENIRSMGRKGKKTTDILATARYADLTREEQVDYNATSAQVGMLSYLSRAKAFGNLKKTFTGGVTASAETIKKGLDYLTLGKVGKLSPVRKPWPGNPVKG